MAWLGAVAKGIGAFLSTSGGQMAASTAVSLAAAKKMQPKPLATKKPIHMPDEEELKRNAIRAVAAKKGSRANTVLTSQDEGTLG